MMRSIFHVNQFFANVFIRYVVNKKILQYFNTLLYNVVYLLK